jgi:hypothetical protein
MADSYAFDLESTRRIVRAVRTVEASPRGYLGPLARRTGDIGRDPVMLLKVTSATPTGNLYPAEVQVYGGSAGTTANLCSCWAFDPAGAALTVGYYVGRALHLNTDGTILYGVEAKTPPSGSTLASPTLTTPTITSPTIAGDLIFSEGSSSTISANTNNYAPSAWGPVLPLNVTSASNLTGLVPPATVGSSTVLQTTLYNTGSSSLTLISTSSSSSSANQFSVPGGGNVVLPAGGALTVVYNPATSKWVPVGSSSSYLLQTYPVATTAPANGQSLIYSTDSGQYAPSTLPTAGGGTGLATPSTYQLLAGPATSGGALQQITGVGTSGQVLTSNGDSALPTWQAAGGGGGSPMLVSGITGMVTLVGVVSYTISGTTYYSPLYNGFSTIG